MHKYYDPRLFHVMKTEEELKIAFAPKEVDGRLLQAGEADLLTKEQKLSSAVDVVDAQHFIAAGFDVNFVGPEDVLPPGAAHAHDASKDETPGEAVSGVAEGAGEALGVGLAGWTCAPVSLGSGLLRRRLACRARKAEGVECSSG